MSRVARHSSEAEIQALEKLCETLAGFGADIALEWVDGYMTALVAGPRAIPISEWIPVMLGDAVERAFADPLSLQQALDTLLLRWNIIASQLDPESLLDQPDRLRLGPLMPTYDDAARDEVVAAGHLSAEEAAVMLQTGALWSEGFFDAIDAFSGDWPDPDVETEEGRWYDDGLSRVLALRLAGDDLKQHLAEHYPGETLERDQLVDEAMFAVQDLRVYWLDRAPKPATRRVEPTPGRNDPCPCGSGKKYKKCHGAAAPTS